MDTSGYLASPWSGGSCFFCQLQKAFKRSPESATIFKSDCFIKKRTLNNKLCTPLKEITYNLHYYRDKPAIRTFQ